MTVTIRLINTLDTHLHLIANYDTEGGGVYRREGRIHGETGRLVRGSLQ
jgi:hypothetical protein